MVDILENETFSSFLNEGIQFIQLLIGWYNPFLVAADWASKSWSLLEKNQ